MKYKKIKFPVRDKPDFIKELREKVKDYFESNHISRNGNSGMVFKTIVMLSVFLLPYFLMLGGVIVSPAGILIGWIIMGIGVAGTGMTVMHDASHGSYSKNKKVNRFLGYSLYLLGGFPANWNQQHNVLHHGYTNIEDHDEDISPAKLLRFSPHKSLLRIHRFQHLYAWFFYSIMTLMWTTVKDYTQLYRYHKEGIVLSTSESYPLLFIKLVISKIIYYILFLVIPIIVISVPWYWIVISFVTMHLIAGLILATIFQTAHVVPDSEYPLPDDDGNMENNWAIHQLLTTSDFAPENKILSWYIGGLNYQIEHHLFPNISHVHYKDIAILVKETADKYGLPYHVQPGFVQAVKSHFTMLKFLGRNTDAVKEAEQKDYRWTAKMQDTVVQ